MSEFMTQLWSVLMPILITGIAGLVGIAINQLANWLKAKAKTEQMDQAITQVSDMAHATVANLEREMRPVFSDGKLTKAEGQKIKQIAINSIKEQTPQAIAVIAEGGKSELNDYIGGKVEQAVTASKIEKKV